MSDSNREFFYWLLINKTRLRILNLLSSYGAQGFNELAKFMSKGSLTKELTILLQVNLVKYEFIRKTRGKYHSVFYAKHYTLSQRGANFIDQINRLESLFNFWKFPIHNTIRLVFLCHHPVDQKVVLYYPIPDLIFYPFYTSGQSTRGKRKRILNLLSYLKSRKSTAQCKVVG